MLDVAIIGSGYGGAVVAARLAAHGRVLLIERGRRWSTGQFPQSVGGLARAYLTRRNPLGLWAMRMGAGTGNAFVSGFGGASLVNYGITARPDAHVFDEWPLSASQMAPYYERALAALGPGSNPVAGELGDQDFLDWIEPGRRVDLVNTIDWDLCTQCGHCMPGCNVGAKRSLDRTYLARALAAGAQARLETTVMQLRPLAAGGGHELLLARTDDPQQREWIQARHVVIACGTLGTLDLLQRSRGAYALSPMFGERMSMNGDGVAFLYNTRHRLSGHHGAPITTSVRLPFVDPAGRTRTLMVMSGRLPLSLMRISGAIMATVAGSLVGRRVSDDGAEDPRRVRARRRLRDFLRIAEGGALSQTFMYKLDGQDQSAGRCGFDARGRAAIDWPDYAEDPVLRFAEQRLQRWATEVGGTLIPNLGSWLGMPSFGVHPLGGCRMGTSVEDGVVDDRCRVLQPGGHVHPGLWIADGSAVPAALGVPASLTVAALAERAAEQLARAL